MYTISFTAPEFIAGEALTIQRPRAIEDPETAYEVLSGLSWADNRESAWVLSLNTKHRIIAVDLVSVGSIDHTFMTPRDIYRIALGHGAAAIVVAHNHPSGEVKPSRDDLRVSARLVSAGQTIGIELLDHLIVGCPVNDAWTSLARRGEL